MRAVAAAVVGAWVPLAAAGAERAFTLVSVNGAVPPAQQVLRVTKGDTVAVNITANTPGEAHLHGYKLSAKVVPGKTASWKFVAHATGRYRLEWHAADEKGPGHHGAPLATLEVLPK